jgi:hypothetical protein
VVTGTAAAEPRQERQRDHGELQQDACRCRGIHNVQFVLEPRRRQPAPVADEPAEQRQRFLLLVGEGDPHRLDRGCVERGGVLHASANAVRVALVERNFDIDPFAGLGLEVALVAARHEAQARRADVAAVGAPVAFHVQNESGGEQGGLRRCTARENGFMAP